MNYYLNVSLIGSSTKNDRCQDITIYIGSQLFVLGLSKNYQLKSIILYNGTWNGKDSWIFLKVFHLKINFFFENYVFKGLNLEGDNLTRSKISCGRISGCDIIEVVSNYMANGGGGGANW